tara:strand:- start:44 stop:436 length:393 start_codon:yes stop_codon:yes gene_type:complete
MAKDAINRPTNWTDTLPPEARDVVDNCLDRILLQDWRQRRDTIETTIAAASNTASATGAEAPEHLKARMVAAIIERLQTPAIVELEQAELFAMSACPDHQIAACDWLIEAAAGAPQLPDVVSTPVGMRLH